ncbi:ADK-domain-containing protein [Pisolithus sp. B1]|nr:ADK-domain-containing protein [Pisolithus sp. B1]
MALSLFKSGARPRCPAWVRSVSNVTGTTHALPIYMNLPVMEGSPTDANPSLRMLIFGKPCAGKGTLTSKLTDKYDIHSISTGDLLRQHILERTDIGKEAEEIVASGGLLPDELMLDLVAQKLDTLRKKACREPTCRTSKETHLPLQNWILDGFPRTQRQGRLLDNYLKHRNLPLSLVVNVDIQDDVILNWIADRWVHIPSGRVYSTSYKPPKVSGYDDVTGEPLTKRPDDTPEIFSRRLDHYYAQTSPLLYYYASRSPHATRLVNLDGDVDLLWPTLDSVIRESFPTVRERAMLARARLPGQMQVRSSF